MDAVITYVNGLDPEWQRSYSAFTGVPVEEKRYRDWGTLKYLLRGIQNCMPFIDKVFLLVCSESQVPAWVNREQVRVVLHSDIIPAEYLPTFNSSTIEMFIHRIPDLDERYIYFNDDTYPLRPCTEETFFPAGIPADKFSRHLFSAGLFKHQVRNSNDFALKALGRKPGLFFIRPQHAPSPMLKSVCSMVYDAIEDVLLASISPLREKKNCNQYVFLDYLFYQGRIKNRRLSNRHISLAVASPESVSAFLANPSTDFVCINDVHMKEEKMATLMETLPKAFAGRFPEESRFEL